MNNNSFIAFEMVFYSEKSDHSKCFYLLIKYLFIKREIQSLKYKIIIYNYLYIKNKFITLDKCLIYVWGKEKINLGLNFTNI